MKRKRFTLILILIAIVVLAVIVISLTGRNSGNAEQHQPGSIEIATEEHSTQNEPEKERSADAVELTAEEWQAIVLEALGCGDMQAETLISSGNEMTISGELPKQTITNWLNNADEDSKGMYQSILSILPDSLQTSLTCQIGSSDGEVQISGVSMTVSGIDVPMDVLDGVWDSVNSNLNDSLETKISSVSDVSMQDGTIVLEP